MRRRMFGSKQTVPILPFLLLSILLCVANPSPTPINWSNFGFDLKGKRYNRSETILSPVKVGGLSLAGQVHTGGQLLSSAAVVNNVAYFGSLNNTFYGPCSILQHDIHIVSPHFLTNWWQTKLRLRPH
jgi:hypothetical protein